MISAAIPVAKAGGAPFYLKLPLGVEAEFTLSGEQGVVLSGSTDIRGQYYQEQGPPPGDYTLTLHDARSAESSTMQVRLAPSENGLATVLRPQVSWAGADAPATNEEAGFMSPKVLILIMMLCCVVVLVLILHRKGRLGAIGAGLALRKGGPVSPDAAASTGAQAGGQVAGQERPGMVSTVAGEITLKEFKKMENTLARGKGLCSLAGTPVALAEGWRVELGDIVLKRQHHVGGVGGVYEAYGKKDSSRRLAVKLPLSTVITKANNAFDIESIRTEFENNKTLSGSMRLVQFYELRRLVVVDGDKRTNIYFSVMEFFPGQTLREIMGLGRDFDIQSRRIVLRELVEALAEAHSKKRIHNDIKPDNVLVLYSGSSKTVNGVKLIDFGAQTEVRGDDPDRARKLTPDYCAPEVLGGRPPSERSDIYAMGLLAYELFEGALPFPSGKGSEHNASMAEFELRFKNLEDLPAVANVIRKMVVKEEARRGFSTAGQVLDALKSI
jgi:hypothetical protein